MGVWLVARCWQIGGVAGSWLLVQSGAWLAGCAGSWVLGVAGSTEQGVAGSYSLQAIWWVGWVYWHCVGCDWYVVSLVPVYCQDTVHLAMQYANHCVHS